MPDVLRTVGRYELLSELGRGGMAIVYLARQTDLDRHVALKELARFHQPDPMFGKRFERESRMIASLSHPNIVTVFDYFEFEGVPFIAMEYVDRGSLRPFIKNLTIAQTAGVLEGLLAGLAHAETRGVVHRDLKPENLMLTADGRVKIADFGIAKVTSGSTNSAMLTATGMTVGTPLYMAPEQAMAQDIGPPTDIYSVGAMAYEMFCGRPPIEGGDSPMAILLRVLNEAPTPPRALNPSLSPELSAWIERLLVKDPKKRTQNATQAWDELEEILIHELGPRWRREARLLDRGVTIDTPTPLTPAPFESGVQPTPTPGSHPAAPPEPTPPPAAAASPPAAAAPAPPPAPTPPPAPPPTPPAGRAEDDGFESFYLGAQRGPGARADTPDELRLPPVEDVAPPPPAAPPPSAAVPPPVGAPPPSAAVPPPVAAPPPSAAVPTAPPSEVAAPPAHAAPPPVAPPPRHADPPAPAPAPPREAEPAAAPPAADAQPAAPSAPPAAPAPEPASESSRFRTFRGGAAPRRRKPEPQPEPPRAEPPVPEPVAMQPPAPAARTPQPPAPPPPAPPRPAPQAPARQPDPTPLVPDHGYAPTIAPQAVQAPAPPAPPAPEKDPASAAARRRTALLVGIGVLCAVIGFVIAPSKTKETDPPALTGSASQNGVTVSFPASFAKVDPSPDIKASIKDPIALAPTARKNVVVAAGTVDASGPTLLPADLLKSFGGDGPPEPTRVRLGELEALRYSQLSQAGSSDVLRFYAVPTSAGVAVVVCAGPPADLEALAGDCERIASSLQLSGATAFPAGPSAEYATRLDSALKGLAGDRAVAFKRLSMAGSRVAQANGAAAAGRAYDRAAGLLRGGKLSPYDAAANKRLVADLRAVGDRYAALARAARRGRRGPYNRARQAIPTAEARVGEAVANLKELGYDIAS